MIIVKRGRIDAVHRAGVDDARPGRLRLPRRRASSTPRSTTAARRRPPGRDRPLARRRAATTSWTSPARSRGRRCGRPASASRAVADGVGGEPADRRVDELDRVECGSGRPARRRAAVTCTRQPGFALAYTSGSVASTCVAPCGRRARGRPRAGRCCRSRRCRSRGPARRGSTSSRPGTRRAAARGACRDALGVAQVAGVLEGDAQRERVPLRRLGRVGEQLGDVDDVGTGRGPSGASRSRPRW